jgi:hypothetical protein
MVIKIYFKISLILRYGMSPNMKNELREPIQDSEPSQDDPEKAPVLGVSPQSDLGKCDFATA